ncbi:MAG TPA: DUF4191 family protein [Nitriliruptorales bacterium]
MNRLAQLKLLFNQTREVDDKLVALLAVAAVVGFAVPFVILAVVLSTPVIGAVTAVLVALLAVLTVFGRRSQAAQIAAIEGQPGAALAIVNSMRGLWLSTPAIAVTRKQDMVHRVVGPPGVVLVGEGSAARVKQLLEQEEVRARRVAGDAPVRTVRVGQGKGAVELGSLRLHLMKLSRELKKDQVRDLEKKLNALGSGKIPMPKGPIPGGGSRKLR